MSASRLKSLSDRLACRVFARSIVGLVTGTMILFQIRLQDVACELRSSAPEDGEVRKQQVLVPHAQHLCHLLNGRMSFSKRERIVVDT